MWVLLESGDFEYWIQTALSNNIKGGLRVQICDSVRFLV